MISEDGVNVGTAKPAPMAKLIVGLISNDVDLKIGRASCRERV